LRIDPKGLTKFRSGLVDSTQSQEDDGEIRMSLGVLAIEGKQALEPTLRLVQFSLTDQAEPTHRGV
jgi:hypothetical protein